MYERCKGSRTEQMLDWWPAADYPGACVCIHCSYGVMIVKGSVVNATSQAGFEGKAGTLRTHYVNNETERMSYRKPKTDA